MPLPPTGGENTDNIGVVGHTSAESIESETEGSTKLLESKIDLAYRRLGHTNYKDIQTLLERVIGLTVKENLTCWQARLRRLSGW
jgi:hypothetical protein